MTIWSCVPSKLLLAMRGMVFCWVIMSISIFFWNIEPAEARPQRSDISMSKIFEPDLEDIPFFRAIVEAQDRELQACKTPLACQKPNFLRGLALLYSHKGLAATHFRKVITAKPSSRLAAESRFWLWFIDVLSPQKRGAQLSSIDLARRLTREIVDREFIVYDLVAKLEQTSLESLQHDVDERDKKVDELNQVIAALTKQVSELKKEPARRLSLQKELEASEKKVEELMNQLDALRRIDQELKEKTPPTRPSEELTPAPGLEPVSPN
ncbi:MAG: hypothetical protein NPIRA05_19360 [Nitrospirales bacterium]|nr:MAG: hypothetical protein NPIRA05_19360 [Nitrospirales bacterium]